MKYGSQENSKGFPQIAEHPLPCAECRLVDCHSLHGPVALECILESCHVCSDLAEIDDKISTTHKLLSDLVQKRQQIINKPRHDCLIHLLPVEILTLIFVFFKGASDSALSEDQFKQPPHSPPLLLGAVCKGWRDVTLGAPQLWVDIIIDLFRDADGQLDMVREWAHRSRALPLNITIFLEGMFHENSEEIHHAFQGVLDALRSLAARWNDVALNAPSSFCHDLLNDLEGSPPVNSFTIYILERFGRLEPIELQYPLRPKRFDSFNISGREIPLQWDNLSHFEIASIDKGELLHIICHAANLTHCVAGYDGDSSSEGDFPIPIVPIISHSLIRLELAHHDIFQYITLPSLQYLDYMPGDVQRLDSIVGFINRSGAPLQSFIFRFIILKDDPDPRFEELPAITRLILHYYECGQRIDDFLRTLTFNSDEVILPHLREISFKSPLMTVSSWSLFGGLFPKDSEADSPGFETRSNNSTTFRRPLSSVSIYVSDNDCLKSEKRVMEKDTFLHLLAVQKSGVKLDLKTGRDEDLLQHMAQIYNMQLPTSEWQ